MAVSVHNLNTIRSMLLVLAAYFFFGGFSVCSLCVSTLLFLSFRLRSNDGHGLDPTLYQFFHNSRAATTIQHFVENLRSSLTPADERSILNPKLSNVSLLRFEIDI